MEAATSKELIHWIFNGSPSEPPNSWLHQQQQMARLNSRGATVADCVPAAAPIDAMTSAQGCGGPGAFACVDAVAAGGGMDAPPVAVSEEDEAMHDSSCRRRKSAR